MARLSPNIEQFRQKLRAVPEGAAADAVVLVVLREGRNQTIRIEPPQ